MLTSFLELYASSTGIPHLLLRAAWEGIRRAGMLVGDPSYEAVIHGKRIRLPISHKLPLYVANHPYYDTLPIRLSTYLHRTRGPLTMIDVGANVGDTIVACHQAPEDRFLAIEAHSFFVKDLRRNGAQIPNLVIVEALCSAEDSESTAVRLNSANGTAQVAGASTGRPIPRKKLDTIVSEHSEFSTCNFLKVDTDGSDFEVLRGSQDLIARARPVVYFECDVFDNEDYLDDFFQTMEFFKSVGYMSVVAYDNLGYLFQVFPVDQHEQFRQALEYQLLSKFGYFDLLVLDESCQDFVDLELTYFSRIIADRGKSP